MGRVLRGWNLLLLLAISSGQMAVADGAFGVEKQGGKGPEVQGRQGEEETGKLGDLTLLETSPSPDAEQSGAYAKRLALEWGYPLGNPLGQVPKSPSHSSADLVAQELTRVTGVEVNRTAEGLELVLKTVAERERLVPLIVPEGKDLVIDILDATLAFSIRNGVTELNPTPEISRITVNQADENSIRVRITGEDQTPSAEVVTGRDNLVLSVTLDRATAETEPEGEIEVIATGEAQDDDYFVTDASTATRTDTPLRDIPQSIQVIPQEVLEDQQVIRLNDAIRNASGVTPNSNDPRGQRFQIRGFEGASILRDGFRQTFADSGNSGFQELANIERIEILKGPASIISGAVEPGGVINLVTEKPLSEPFYEFEFKLGNRDLIEPSLDISGPLTADGSLKYRLNALYRNEDSFRDFDTSIERLFLAPTISWQIGDNTDFTFNLEYTDDERPADFGLAAIGDEVADVPFDRITGEPDDILEADFLRVAYNLEHRFNKNWKLRNSFNFIDYDTKFLSAFVFGVDESSGTIFRNFISLDQPSSTYELQTNVVGEFATGKIKHKLLAGFDLNRREQLENIGRGNFENPIPLDIFDPIYGTVLRPDPDNDPIFTNTDTQIDSLGIYLQDQVTLLDNLKLLAGVRYETVEQRTENNPSFFNPESSEETQNEDAFSPRVGIVYQPIEEISLFTSFTRSFVPNTATTVSGELLEPERGEQFELGVKAEVLEGQISTTLAFFNIVKENVSTNDPDNPLFSIAAGKQRSRGIELDIVGEITPSWNIIANYAYTDTETIEDNSGLEGNRLSSAPEHNANLWTYYEIQQGSLQGLGLGIGFNFVGERFGDLANSFELDSYFLTNAAISYQRENWQANLNFRNLFDVDYIESSENDRITEIYPGEDFTVISSVSVKF